MRGSILEYNVLFSLLSLKITLFLKLIRPNLRGYTAGPITLCSILGMEEQRPKIFFS